MNLSNQNNNNNSYNGKVNIMGPNLSTKFSMIDKIPINTNTNYQNVLAGNFERSRLSDAFFSNANIQIIQNGIRKGVYDKSNQKLLVDNQPQDVVVTIMRSIYLQNSKNLDTNISKQIQELNTLVLNFSVNNVYNEAVSYMNYKRDSSTMHIPMSAPIYSNKTNKTLEQKRWF
jgi:hypothetical protein